MKKLKKTILLSVSGLLAVFAPIFITGLTVTAPVAMTGCVMRGGTNDQAAIDASSALLRNAARTGAIAAITPPSGNTNNVVYFALASQAIDTFLTGQDYTPGAFQNALMKINSPYLNNVWVQLAVGGVVDLYQVYYSQYVKDQINGNAYATQFLSAVKQGFDEATGAALPLKAAKSGQGVLPILPRPIQR